MSTWKASDHPRDTSGRFARKGSPEAEARRLGYADVAAYLAAPGRAIPADSGRDEVSANVDPDRHEFVPGTDADDEHPIWRCEVCGDNEGANAHLDPNDPGHVWMDLEGLTGGEIDRLDALTAAVVGDFDGDTLAAAQMVADWISGVLVNDARREVLNDPQAIDGLRAFMEDVRADREDAGDLGRFGSYYTRGTARRVGRYEVRDGKGDTLGTFDDFDAATRYLAGFTSESDAQACVFDNEAHTAVVWADEVNL